MAVGDLPYSPSAIRPVYLDQDLRGDQIMMLSPLRLLYIVTFEERTERDNTNSNIYVTLLIEQAMNRHLS